MYKIKSQNTMMDEFDDDFFDDDFFDGDDFENDFEEDFDNEEFYKKAIGKTIAQIQFDIDEGLMEALYIKFTDKSILAVRGSREKSAENFIFVDEDSFPTYKGAKVLDLEVFEDYTSGDIFNPDVESLVFKTDKGDLEISFENGGKFVGADDYFNIMDEEKYRKSKEDIGILVILVWLLYFD